ncbi:Fur family transcriptional regulator [Lichenibacterium ramalinae]|uniref:Transcriptional repressor n=1 Tax=Lichenibacterium ramalinae TaxID=2316527 RepID=A0A4Q2RDH2_9HYPH|nr:transcriptional repressor [Lichenibacterium ramalinae]RYB04075.1 transcriptional repressor [Lichenibacterium ramalinae]
MTEKPKRRDTAGLIAAELAGTAKPHTAYELLERLRPSGVFAPTTVYRALEKLLASGKIHRIESLNAFVACRGAEGAPHDHGHGELGIGFTVCDRCAAVAEFEDASLQSRIEAAAAAGAFVPRSSIVEIHGLCAACAGEGPAAGRP